MTDTVEQVRKAVAASRYPPLKLRRCAAGLICVSRYGAADDFITTAHDELFIALQFEPIKGAENTEKIAAVEGVGMVFIGANGLSGNCGMLVQYSRPEVVSQMTELYGSNRNNS